MRKSFAELSETPRESNLFGVTTPQRSIPAQEELARILADRFGARYLPRLERSLTALCQTEAVHTLVVADDPIKLYRLGSDYPLFFHPSMADQRIERLDRGETDRLLRAAQIQPGDVVVDATVGLASDGLVFAYAVGERGRVIGIEASKAIACLLQTVQEVGSLVYSDAVQMLRKIDIHHGDHVDWLVAQPDNSVDVVYFDPMFRIPQTASASVVPLRSFALPDALTDVAVAQAKRVARRSVVVKESESSGLFQAFGLIPDQRRRKWAYGVWQKT